MPGHWPNAHYGLGIPANPATGTSTLERLTPIVTLLCGAVGGTTVAGDTLAVLVSTYIWKHNNFINVTRHGCV